MCKKTTTFMLTLLAILGAAVLLGSCNTIAGAGEDVSHAGHAIQKTADKHAP